MGLEKQNALPSFRKPPLVEVTCGITFEPFESYRSPHAGLLWHRLRDQFPGVEQATPLSPVQLDPNGMPLPRFWFISEDDSRLVQLQNNRLHYNWRMRPDGGPYPRYESMIEVFESIQDTFCDFVSEMQWKEPEVTGSELTYINHIPRGEGWDTRSDIYELFSGISWRSNTESPLEGPEVLINALLENPEGLMWNANFHLPESQGQFAVKVVPAKRRIDGLPILTFELAVKGNGSDRSRQGLRDWFDQAHEWIVYGFVNFTSGSVQETVWERER